MAVSAEAGNHAFLVPWAIVKGESEDLWRFILSHLVTAFPHIEI